MSYSRQDPGALARELGIFPADDEQPAWAGVARIIRVAAGRWGACRKFDLLRHACELCQAAGFADPTERVERVISALVALRDLEPANVAAVPPSEREVESETDRHVPAGVYLIPALPRVVTCGERAFLMGSLEEIGEQEVARFGVGPASIVRWIDGTRLPGERLLELELGRWELSDWLGYPQHIRALQRWTKGEGAERGGPQVLQDLWGAVVSALRRTAATVIKGDWYALSGHPGAYFGHPGGGGRWTPIDQTPDGIWCAARPGYRDNHWLPGLVEIEAGLASRWIELYDWDEARWAMLARGVVEGAPERFERHGDAIRVDCPLPSQLQRLGALAAREGWTWKFPGGAVDGVVRALVEVGGLRQGQTT